MFQCTLRHQIKEEVEKRVNMSAAELEKKKLQILKPVWCPLPLIETRTATRTATPTATRTATRTATPTATCTAAHIATHAASHAAT